MRVGLHPHKNCYARKVHINAIHRKIREAVAQGKYISPICQIDEGKPLKINYFKVFILQTYAKLPLGQEVLQYDLFYINLSLTI